MNKTLMTSAVSALSGIGVLRGAVIAQRSLKMKDDPKTRPFDLATDALLIEEGCDTSASLMVIIELARALGAPKDFSAGDRFLHWHSLVAVYALYRSSFLVLEVFV
jgi:hypothetical protein